MADIEKATAAKAKGNQHFQKGEFKEAVEAYTEAIKHNSTEHTLYSNRSGAYASLNNYDLALKDAEECVKLAPTFVKGFSRKGLALFHLKKYDEAKATYEAGLKLSPEDAQLKEGLAEVNKAKGQAGKNTLFGPQMWERLHMNPTTREYLGDPEFVKKLQMLSSNPNMFSMLSQGDKRLQTAFGVILGMPFGMAGDDDEPPKSEKSEDKSEEKDKTEDKEEMEVEKEEEETEKSIEKTKSDDASGVTIQDDDETMEDEEVEKPKPKPKPEPKTKPKEAPKAKEAPKKKEDTISPEEAEKKKKQQEALKEKDAGNAAYTKKKFAEALQHYTKAAEIDPTNMVYTTNTAAVHFEMKEYDKCIEVCRKSIEIGRENKADPKNLAKAFLRLGNALAKQKLFAEAIDAYEKGLLEDYTEPLKVAVKKTKELKKKADEQAYLDPAKSEAHRKKGNEHFEKGQWKEAVEEYSEALKRDPTDYKVYSNRCACFTKMMDWGRALADCEECMKINPKFVKIYIRKAKIQHYLQQYHKALETYSKGLDLDPESTELIQGRAETLLKINEENATGKVDPKRRQEALKDPEIQSILRDPMINKVLQDMQTDPAASQSALKDPAIMEKLEKLIAAGVLQAKSV